MEPYVIEKDGKRYMYRSTSHYSKEKGGPVSEVEYMGRVVNGKLRPKKGYRYDETTGEFGPIGPEANNPDEKVVLGTRVCGDVLLLDAIQRRLGILDDLIAAFGDEIGRKIMALSMAYTIRPESLIFAKEVIDRRTIKEILAIPECEDFTDASISEFIGMMGDMNDSIDAFSRRRISNDEGMYVFDITHEDSCNMLGSKPEWGRNRGRAYPSTTRLGLVTDKMGHPLMFHLHPYSMSDVSAPQAVVDDLMRLGGKGPTLVLDRGFVSSKSMMYLLDNGLDFIMPMVVGDNPLIERLMTEVSSSVGDVKHIHVHNGRSYTILRTQIGLRVNEGNDTINRDTIWEDPDGYDLILQDDAEFDSCDRFVDIFVFRDTAAAGRGIARMDVVLDQIIQQLEGAHPRDPQKALQRVAGEYTDLLDFKMNEDGMHLEINQDAHTSASKRKGISMMIAPAGSGRGWKDILDPYMIRDIAADAFFVGRSEMDIDMTRSTDESIIKGQCLIRMVSSIIRAEMLNRIHEVSKDSKTKPEFQPRGIEVQTPTTLLSSLDNIEMIYGNGWKQMTEMTKDNQLIYEMFDIDLTDCRDI
jgi:hypothetical protein